MQFCNNNGAHRRLNGHIAAGAPRGDVHASHTKSDTGVTRQMKTKLGLMSSAVALALAGAVASTPAAAGDWFRRDEAVSLKDAPVVDEGRKFEWSVNGGIASDYIFRGFSQTQNSPAWFAGADASYGMIYAGVWASQIKPEFTSSDAEVDLYAGITPELGPVSFDFGVIYYGYVGQQTDPGDPFYSGGDPANPPVNVDYWEFKAGISTEFSGFSAGATYYYSPDYTFETGPAHTVEGSLGYTFCQVWIFEPTINGLIGYNELEDVSGSGYTYWNAGLELAVEKLTFDFRYWDTDVNTIVDGKNISDSRFVFTAKVELP